MPVPDIALDVGVLQLLLAAAAGGVSMLLFSPVLRFIRGYWLQQTVPSWAAGQIMRYPASLLFMHLQLVLPAVCSLLWVSTGAPKSDVLQCKSLILILSS